MAAYEIPWANDGDYGSRREAGTVFDFHDAVGGWIESGTGSELDFDFQVRKDGTKLGTKQVHAGGQGFGAGIGLGFKAEPAG